MEKLNQVFERRIAVTPGRIIEPMIHPQKTPMTIQAMKVEGEPISYQEAVARPFSPFLEGDAWGSQWDTAWFRFTAEVPSDWNGQAVVALLNLSYSEHEGFGREGLVWIDGKPVIAVNRARQAVPLLETAKGGEKIDFYVEAAANPAAQMGWGDDDLLMPDYESAPLFRLEQAQLATQNNEAFQLKMDYEVCRQAMGELPENEPRRGQLLRALNTACGVLDLGDPTTVTPAREILSKVMACTNGSTNHQITAVGHAHIDTAWLWPLRETIRKCARTFSTALRYMEKYPDYKFVCSQPQQYAWMKEYYPSIFEDIKKAIKRGQWEPVGGMWIEADCNISSGESLVRQFLHGKLYYEEEFDYEVKDLWLPDVFGYAAALPQILKKTGTDWFLTQKISWSDTNKFPHHTFMWEGLDGSQVFTHFPPVDTYNCQMEAQDLMRSVHNFQEHDRATAALVPYGNGDGGGGPTIEHIEMNRRWEDFEGLPKVEMGSVVDFFEKAEKDAIDPPVWRGELYLELHRGTLTSQAYNKRMNRKCELLLRDAEFFQVVAGEVNPGAILSEIPETDRPVWDVDAHIAAKNGDLASQALDRAWKLLLLNQFHDIIPGSSIHWVYQDSRVDYTNIETLAASVRDAAIQRISDKIDSQGIDRPIAVFNTLSQSRREVIEVSDNEFTVVDVPQCGYSVTSGGPIGLPDDISPVEVVQQDGEFLISNGLLRIKIDHDGGLCSVFDLENDRESLAPGQRGNVLQIHKDYPNFWNAWDIDVFVNETTEDICGGAQLELTLNSSARAVVRVTRKFGISRLTQDIIINAGSRRIDFETEVDWQESNRLLKVAFPVDVNNLQASYDTQYGHVERTTHDNTSWDVAKFEVPVHKWVDLSEGDYGVSILNDCKYAADVRGNMMRLTLLKAANAPDPTADKGLHQFTYSLFPHAGGLREGKVIEESYALNCPLTMVPLQQQSGPLDPRHSFFSVDRPGVIIEAIKKAEKSDATIVRLYEATNTRGNVNIHTSLPCDNVEEVDLMERNGTPLEENNGQVSLKVTPFQIRTISLH